MWEGLIYFAAYDGNFYAVDAATAEYTEHAGLHAFRHCLAMVLIVEENVDPKTAQGILRHADAGLTLNVYTHAQAKRAALERFESRLVQ